MCRRERGLVRAGRPDSAARRSPGPTGPRPALGARGSAGRAAELPLPGTAVLPARSGGGLGASAAAARSRRPLRCCFALVDYGESHSTPSAGRPPAGGLGAAGATAQRRGAAPRPPTLPPGRAGPPVSAPPAGCARPPPGQSGRRGRGRRDALGPWSAAAGRTGAGRGHSPLRGAPPQPLAELRLSQGCARRPGAACSA